MMVVYAVGEEGERALPSASTAARVPTGPHRSAGSSGFFPGVEGISALRSVPAIVPAAHAVVQVDPRLANRTDIVRHKLEPVEVALEAWRPNWRGSALAARAPALDYRPSQR